MSLLIFSLWFFQVLLGVFFFVSPTMASQRFMTDDQTKNIIPTRLWPILVWICGILILCLSVFEIFWFQTLGS